MLTPKPRRRFPRSSFLQAFSAIKCLLMMRIKAAFSSLSRNAWSSTRLWPNPEGNLCRKRMIAVRMSCLILLFLITASTRLYPQEAAPVSLSAPMHKVSPPASAPAPLLVQELPYCELGYGPCGGECSSDEGKKKWACAANTLPCHHEGQRCSCEAADICKAAPKKTSPRNP